MREKPRSGWSICIDDMPEVESDAVRRPARRQVLGHGRETVFDQAEAAAAASAEALGEAAAGSRSKATTRGAGVQEGAAIAAGAEGAVDDQLAGRRLQRRDHLVQQHGTCAGASLMPVDSRRGAPLLGAAGDQAFAGACAAGARGAARKASRGQIWNRSPRPTTATQSVRPNRSQRRLGQGDAAGGVEGELRHAARRR